MCVSGKADKETDTYLDSVFLSRNCFKARGSFIGFSSLHSTWLHYLLFFFIHTYWFLSKSFHLSFSVSVMFVPSRVHSIKPFWALTLYRILHSPKATLHPTATRLFPCSFPVFYLSRSTLGPICCFFYQSSIYQWPCSFMSGSKKAELRDSSPTSNPLLAAAHPKLPPDNFLSLFTPSLSSALQTKNLNIAKKGWPQ